MSLECAAPTRRGSSQLAPSSVLVSPLTMPVALNSADSPAIRSSAREREAHAAAVRDTVDRREHRLRHAPQREDQPRVVPHRSLRDATDGEPVDVRDDPVVLEVEPGAEATTRAGEHHDVGVVVVGDGLQRLVELDDELDRHRVQAIGPVQRDHARVRLRLLDQDQAHAPTRFRTAPGDRQFAGSGGRATHHGPAMQRSGDAPARPCP